MRTLLVLLLVLVESPAIVNAQVALRDPQYVAKLNNRPADPGLPFPSGAVFGYKLDEASGTRVDYYTGNDLTAAGTVNSVAGAVGNAASFTGAFGMLSVSDNADVSFGAGVDVTISFFIHPTADNDWIQMVAKAGDGTNPEYSVYKNGTDDKLTWTVYSGSGGAGATSVQSSGTIANDTTYHVLLQYDGSEISMSIDNGAPTTTAYTDDIWDGAESFVVGYLVSSGIAYTGWIDNLFVWKRTLNSTEKQNLANGATP